jgi:hypothetical protein
MLKNTASQKIGAQMVSASDGSAFTSAVTVAVTVDAGTQAAGSVGSGACTHEGNGYHTYTPSQAETNGDLLAFTFTGTGAIPVTVQVYTIAGDAFTRLGAPAGASVSADIAAIKGETASILTDTAEIGAAGAGLTALASQASVTTIDDFLDTEVAAIKAKTDQLTFTTANKVDSTIQAAGDFAQGAADKVWSTATRALTDKVGFALSAAGVQAIWDALTTALTTVGSVGKLLVDNINATISSRLASASYTAPLDAAGTRAAVGLAAANLDTQLAAIDDFLDTEIAAILEDTSTTLDDMVDDLETRLSAVRAGYLDNLSGGAVALQASVDDLEGRLTDALATVLQAHSLAIGRVVVGVGSTTTAVKLSTVNGAAPSAVNDFYNGRVLIFTSGALTLQAVEITAYDGASTTATVSAATGAPANAVTAVLV